MKQILVTGVAGFIGSKVAQILIEKGLNVIGIDNLNDQYDVSIKHWRLNGLREKKAFQFIELDIESSELLAPLFEKERLDAVIHLAARAGVRDSIEVPHQYMQTNLMGTLNLLECMKTFEVGKLVMASSSSLYAGQPLPYNESLSVNTPLSPYAVSKKSAELLAHSYHKIHQLDVSILRYFSVYGPMGRPDLVIFRFIKWIIENQPVEIFGDGTQSRDFTFVDDVAMATIAALKPVGYEVFNIGSGRTPTSLNQILSWIEEYTEKKAKIVYKEFNNADILTSEADISKARRLLGWNPTVAMKDGLHLCIEDFLKNIDFAASVNL